MSKKDYEAIAAEISGTRTSAENFMSGAELIGAQNAMNSIAGRLADIFGASNPRFDRARFLAACQPKAVRS